MAVLAVLALAATMAVVWVAKPLDREAFCTKAIAIHHPQGQTDFPEYGPLVDSAWEFLSPPDALRIVAAVKKVEGTRTSVPAFDGVLSDTRPVGDQLTRLCPDHVFYSVVAQS